jgi:SSS family transporter
MTRIGGWDATICVVYLGVVFLLAVISARGQQDNEDYFVGGRRMNWWVVGISMFATSFSSLSFLGLPQRGAYQDFSFYVTILCIPLVITPILWFLFIPLYTRLQVSSGYEYLGRRFGVAAQRIGSLLYCTYALLWMGIMLYAIAITLQVVLGLSDEGYRAALIGVGAFATIYTVLGGLKAVIWTDVLQAVVLGGSVLLVIALAISRIEGGWSSFYAVASAHEKFRLVQLELPPLAGANFSSPTSLYSAIAVGLFMYLPGYTVAQNMIQRYVCCGSRAAGRGVVLLSAGINTVLGFLFLLVGTALFVFYVQQGGGLPVEGVELRREDQILPYFVATELSGFGLVGLILAGLFAAAMSTIDSGVNGVSSVIVFDWLGGRQLPLRISRGLTAGLGLIVILAALYVDSREDNLIDVITAVAGTALGMLMSVYLLGMLVPRANMYGTLCGVVAGGVALSIAHWSVQVPVQWLGLFSMVPTFVAGWAASWLFAPPSAESLAGTLWRSELDEK